MAPLHGVPASPCIGQVHQPSNRLVGLQRRAHHRAAWVTIQPSRGVRVVGVTARAWGHPHALHLLDLPAAMCVRVTRRHSCGGAQMHAAHRQQEASEWGAGVLPHPHSSGTSGQVEPVTQHHQGGGWALLACCSSAECWCKAVSAHSTMCPS